ncbi:MAG: DHH family phosphoesterase [Candidatus Pacebacteria bacterium]|nr:DHH family phosphoesterase [Candidatus Paceibacterota bacterium]
MHKNILTEEQKVIAKQILEHLQDGSTQSILLHCHPSPDPDSLGSVLATKFALESMGKKVTIIAGDSKTPDAFMHFPGANEILVQNYFETDVTKFDIFLILDSGSTSMISRKAPIVFPPESNPNLKTIVIDHHASNTGYGDINLIALQYMSTTEILFDIFQEWGIFGTTENKFSKEIATNLYVGLFTDSGGFRYERVTDHSFYMAGVLYEYNPSIIDVITTLENSSSKGFVDYLGLALSQKKIFHASEEKKEKGSFVISYMKHEDIARLGLVSDDWNGGTVCNMLKSVVGWNVVVMMIEEVSGEVKCSFRTRDAKEFDVSKVAVLLGGGGHKAAAGAMIKKPMDEAIEFAAETIRKELFS